MVRRRSRVQIPPEAPAPNPRLFDSRETIINLLIHIKSIGYAESTLKTISIRLRHLDKICDMNNPLEVKRVIASETCANTVRQGLVTAYNHYMNFCGLSWEIPSYQREDYEIQVPLEENLNLIIGSATRVTAMKFLLMKEGGLRPIEIYKVEVRDFGFERKPLAVRTAKGSKGITARLIESTVQMIKDYVPIKGPALDDFLSRGSTDTLRPLFTESRRKAALKLSKPELLKIFPSSHV